MALFSIIVTENNDDDDKNNNKNNNLTTAQQPTTTTRNKFWTDKKVLSTKSVTYQYLYLAVQKIQNKKWKFFMEFSNKCRTPPLNGTNFHPSFTPLFFFCN